jgi:hypothetical protein
MIALMMEAERTSETSVYFNETTRRYFQKAVIFILAAVRTSNLTKINNLRQTFVTEVSLQNPLSFKSIP